MRLSAAFFLWAVHRATWTEAGIQARPLIARPAFTYSPNAIHHETVNHHEQP
ncbi:hypothetical protein [Nonomuraea sp. NPDC002799]